MDVSGLKVTMPQGMTVPYRDRAWRTAMRRLANFQEDMDGFSAWRVASARVPSCGGDACAAVVSGSLAAFADDLRALSAKGLDLGGVEAWLRLWDMSCAASVMVCCYDWRPPSVSAWEVIDCVSTLVGLASSVASGETSPHGLAALSSRDVARLSSSVAIDFVCGRGGAWVRLLRDTARVAGRREGRDADAFADALAGLRTKTVLGLVAGVDGVGPERAAQTLGGEFVNIATLFDDWQRARHEASRIHYASLSDDDVRACLDMRCVSANADLLSGRETTSGLTGWCADLGLSPVTCLFALDSSLGTSIRASYARKANADALMRRLAPVRLAGGHDRRR
jgi:hypothetical protein